MVDKKLVRLNGKPVDDETYRTKVAIPEEP
jgi:hypothetical protein